MKAAIYVRQAQAPIPGERATAIEIQGAICRAAAVEAGYAVHGHHAFSDVGSSGITLERPGLAALRRAIRDREIEAIFVYSVDRLSRDLVNLFLIAGECEANGIALRFVHGAATLNPVQRARKRRIDQRLRCAFGPSNRGFGILRRCAPIIRHLMNREPQRNSE